jgi:SpoIID/LytB domain protein
MPDRQVIDDRRLGLKVGDQRHAGGVLQHIHEPIRRLRGTGLMPMRLTMLRRCLMLLAVLAGFGACSAQAGAATLFTLTGHGWGHGIGMSQYGALGYAQHGWTHAQILDHYYTGTQLGLLAPATTERVLLTDGRASVHLAFASAATGSDAGGSRTLPAGSYRVDVGPVAGKLRLWSVAGSAYVWTGISSPLIVAPGGAPLRLDDLSLNGYSGDHWWGSFRVTRSGGSMDVVNLVPMEKYVRGVVPCEVPASWPAQAVQSQAVAARSYAAATRGGHVGFDAYPDTRSQEYCPIERQAAASDAAVAATQRQVVMYSGQVATTFFSSSSGGRTSSIAASWGGTNLPYLVPVVDRYDAAGGANPNHTWAPRLYTQAGLAAALGLPGVVRTLDQTIDEPSQRVTAAVFHTSQVDHGYTGSGVQSAMGLRSTYFRLLQVSLSAPVTATAGHGFTLSGRLWPVPVGPFHLEFRYGSDTTWRTASATPTLDSEGRFASSRRPLKNISYRLVRPMAFSPVVHVAVHPALTLVASNGSFHGTMLPHLAGSSVTLQRHGSSGWVARGSATVGPKGGYFFSLAPKAGSWRVRFGGDPDHAAGFSPVLVV